VTRARVFVRENVAHLSSLASSAYISDSFSVRPL
jgi:hypothetical protein